jgi:nitrogen regulation protein NR(I)
MNQRNEMSVILVVDDEEMIRFAFQQFLMDEGHTPLLAGDAESALNLVREHKPEIVFLDYRLPGRDGLDLLEEIRGKNLSIAVIFMTAFGAMDVAIKAMQLGAYEYLTKPLDLDKIRTLIGRIIEGKKFLSGIDEQTKKDQCGSLDRIVGRSSAIQEVFKMIGLLTMQEVTVLITGESGVGKELVAKAIHENSARRNNPFIAVNCGAMPEALLESEMFGYEKGAFTGADSRKAGKFEIAKGGTIFLDEIGELQPALQVKLLRVLQERSFERIGGNTSIDTDARVIAATNKDLSHEVSLGHFRRDLFYRLHLVQIHIPPLRERVEDIETLVEHFIRKANTEMERQVRGVTGETLKRLKEYSWPGNVRELENQIKRAMVISREDVLSEYLFELHTAIFPDRDGEIEVRLTAAAKQYLAEILTDPDPSQSIFDRVVGAVERVLIQEALRRTDGNQVHAAQLLGVNRSTLRKKRRDYGL